MKFKDEWKAALLIAGGFLASFFLPIGTERFDNALLEAFYLLRWYAREHVLLCLIPAFFIAGAIAVFISKATVIKYLGPKARKTTAYGVASVSGTILAVCSCTVLPLFAGIYRMGAGLGPATAFLYSGPAINVLAIALTARVLGLEMGIARAVGAVVFSVVIGLAMETIFRKEKQSEEGEIPKMSAEGPSRTLWQNGLYLGSMVGILVFANWGKPADPSGIWHLIYSARWIFTGLFSAALGIMLVVWIGIKWWKVAATAVPVLALALALPEQPLLAFSAGVIGLSLFTGTDKGEGGEWFASSWGFARQILPLLFLGILIAGILLGRPGSEGLIPSGWISSLVGGNSLSANFFASFAGAFMYFATLTEIPILQGLIGAGMGKGPALALLLAGPALSLPNMLVIRSVLGTRKTLVFIGLAVVMATLSGMVYGSFYG